jgi:hypothetical protein
MRKALFATALALAILSPRVALAQSQSVFSAGVIPFANLTDEFTTVSGATSTYKAALAPMAFKANVEGERFTVDGKLLFSYLYDPNNRPLWALAPNHVGKYVDLEAAVGWKLNPYFKVRGGVTHTYLDRGLSVRVGNRFQPVNVQTQYTGPMVGVAADAGESMGRLVARANGSFLFYLRQVDTFFEENNSTSINNRGVSADGTLGYRFTDWLALTGTPSFKAINSVSGSDGPDGKQSKRMFGVSVQVEIF